MLDPIQLASTAKNRLLHTESRFFYVVYMIYMIYMMYMYASEAINLANKQKWWLFLRKTSANPADKQQFQLQTAESADFCSHCCLYAEIEAENCDKAKNFCFFAGLEQDAYMGRTIPNRSRSRMSQNDQFVSNIIGGWLTFGGDFVPNPCTIPAVRNTRLKRAGIRQRLRHFPLICPGTPAKKFLAENENSAKSTSVEV